MFAQTEKIVLVEYSIDIVYETLICLFPVKYFRLAEKNDVAHAIEVYDDSNYTFQMFITLNEYSANTTTVKFNADYPHAIADLTGGGKTAIYNILDELLKELDKKPKEENVKSEYENDGTFEVVDYKTFVNPVKSQTNTKTVIFGYLCCILSIILPILILFSDNPTSSTNALVFVATVLFISFGISVAGVLQYSESPKAKMHGRIQICLCGLWFIIAGIFIHISLAIVGVIIVGIVIGYSVMRDRKYNL